MSQPVSDKAEVAIEYPDKVYIGTFTHNSRFDAHLDEAGISLSLLRVGTDETRKTVHMHFNYGLFAAILRELAKGAAGNDAAGDHRQELREAANALAAALA